MPIEGFFDQDKAIPFFLDHVIRKFDPLAVEVVGINRRHIDPLTVLLKAVYSISPRIIPWLTSFLKGSAEVT